ncbi:MAG: hypothetical protein AAGG44_05315 [Planctomycetota bacterium]
MNRRQGSRHGRRERNARVGHILGACTRFKQTSRVGLSRRNRSGYVLLLVIVLLVIAATLTVRFANEVMTTNLATLRSVKHMQAKWGKLSCERVILPMADSVFERLNQPGSKGPVWQIQQTTDLGNQRIQLVLTDESAKASLGNLMRDESGRGALSKMQRLVSPSLASALEFPAGPGLGNQLASSVQKKSPGIEAIASLPEIRRLGGERRLVEFLDKVTVWWDGPINLNRADDEALLATCETVLTRGRSQRFLTTLRESPTVDVEVLLQRVVKNEDEQRRLRPLLSDASFAFALWSESRRVGSSDRAGDLTVCVRSLSDTGQLTVQRIQFH